MTEIVLNQLATTLPIHFFAYAPFINHLRWGKKKTFAIVAAMEGFYILLFCILLKADVSLSLIQALSMPIFGILFFISVKMEPGKIMFLYVFSISYLLAVRGAASFLAKTFFKDTEMVFYSLESGVLTLGLFVLTMPVILRFFNKTAQIVFETHAPQVWKSAWLLPTFNTAIVMIFTYSPTSDEQINARFMLTRILSILCMFLVYYFVLSAISQLQQRITAEERARYLEQLTDVQEEQYSLLKSRMEETKQARHDLRQHLRAIQGYIDSENLPALSAYVKAYGESIPGGALHEYSQNYAVDSVLGFYAEKAAASGIAMEIFFCPLAKPPIPEPELCVLLGNLLENALDSCCQNMDAAVPPTITIRAKRVGSHMLALTVDNTCPHPPVSKDGRFLSSKHEGFGTGTESVRSIAQRYQGDARFEWKDGMFLVSVMLNP